MTWGNNGATPGAQPAVGPTGAPIFANQGTLAAPVGPGAVLGQAGAPPNGASPFYQTSFESVMAAVSRGEVSLNMLVAAGNPFGGVGNANGNPTLMQAISQGLPQNGTNGLNGKAETGGTVNAGSAAVATGVPAGATTAFGGTQTVDAKQTMNVPAISSPVQYGGS